MSGSGQPRRVLLSRHGTFLLALPIAEVIETMRPLAIEPLAGMPGFVLGLAVVRGAPVPVIDIGFLIDGRKANATRWVSVRAGERALVLAVESIATLGELPPEGTSPMPPLLRKLDPDVVTAIGATDAALLILLGTARLLDQSDWHQFDRRAQTS